MLFNSYIFVFLFLPLSVAGYYFLNNLRQYELGRAWLIVMSLWFYAYFNVKYLPLIVLSVLVNYAIYRLIRRNAGKKRGAVRFLKAAGAGLNLLLLGYFKYRDFFTENINALFGTDYVLKHILLPLGISFFTLQQIGFLVDAGDGEDEGCSFVNYALFVTFFPQLIAGPIVTHDEMIPQFADLSKKSFDAESMAKGIYRFVIGLSKKVLLADVLGRSVDLLFSEQTDISTLTVLISALAYMLQIYFDFSGYSDMAMGIGSMFRIKLPENFDSPYRAADILDFWKRWHLTLTRYFTRYVYIPLGGSRKGKLRSYVNSMTVFIVSGLWHGASWTYVLWGTLHGIASAVNRNTRIIKNTVVLMFIRVTSLIFMFLTLIIFRAVNLEQAFRFIRILFMPDGGNGRLPAPFLESFRMKEIFYPLKALHLMPDEQLNVMMAAGLLSFGFLVCFFAPNSKQLTERFRPGALQFVITLGLFVWCVVSFSQVSTFLYFNF